MAEDKIEMALGTFDLSSQQSSVKVVPVVIQSSSSNLFNVLEFVVDNKNEAECTLDDGMNTTLTPMQQVPCVSAGTSTLQLACNGESRVSTSNNGFISLLHHSSSSSCDSQQKRGQGCQTILEKTVVPVLEKLVTIVSKLEADNEEMKILLSTQMVSSEGIQPDPDLPRMPAESLEEFLLIEEFSKIPQQAKIKYLSAIGGLHVGNATRRIWAALETDKVSNQLSWIGANNKCKLQGLNINRIFVVSVNKIIPTATEMEVLVTTKVWIRKSGERMKKGAPNLNILFLIVGIII